jgi:hypothetical protein
MPTLGQAVKAILESTFDVVQGSTVIYVDPLGGQHNYPAIVADEIIRVMREGVSVNQIGVEDQVTKKFLIRTASITNTVGTLDPAGYFLYDNERYDFSEKQPVQNDLTPLKDALKTMTLVWVRKAVELEHTDEPNPDGTTYQYGDWTETQ